MKLLKVTSDDDYGMLNFEDVHGGTPVIDVINNLKDYEYTEECDCDGSWLLEVVEFPGNVEDLDPGLITWIKRQIDYDNAKHDFFFFENEVVKSL